MLSSRSPLLAVILSLAEKLNFASTGQLPHGQRHLSMESLWFTTQMGKNPKLMSKNIKWQNMFNTIWNQEFLCNLEFI
jgi:hypothetical protein